MNAEVVPAAIAACGGAGLAAAVLHYERRRDSAMRASRARLDLRFPFSTAPESAVSALRVLTGLDERQELILELAASEGEIRHRISVPAAVRQAVLTGMSAAVPGLRFDASPRTRAQQASVSLTVFVPSPIVLHERDLERASRAVLGLAGALRHDERLVLRWAVASGRPRSRGANLKDPGARSEAAAWERKIQSIGLRVSGLVLVRAASRTRAREIASGVNAALRAREDRHGTLRPRFESSGRSLASEPRVGRSSGWLTPSELLPLLGWPIGDEVIPGVEMGGGRERLVPRSVPTRGRVLFVGRDATGERRVALSPAGARHHMIAVGPSGTGKSVLIGRSILDDIRAGFGGVVFDPKSDLIEDVLDRVAPRDADRIVVLDPADARPAPAIDVLGAGDPDLRTDVLIGALAQIFKDSFGIRSQIYFRLGLRTLADVPGATIADLPRLFFDARFRAAAVHRLSDPFLGTQWQAFESLSAPAQAEHVQSPMAKLSALLSRPAVRAVLAAPKATVDVGALLAERRWLFVSLSPGRLGEPASQLLGSVLLYAAWSAIEGRSILPAKSRDPILLYVDELATVAALPFSTELLLERARGLGAGVVVALQSLGRLPESTRAALLANAATLISFRAPADEATRIARELPGLEARDLLALGRFEVAARVGLGAGSEVAIVTGRTEPWPRPTGMSKAIRDRSSERFGVTPGDAPRDTDLPDEERRIGRKRGRP